MAQANHVYHVVCTPAPGVVIKTLSFDKEPSYIRHGICFYDEDIPKYDDVVYLDKYLKNLARMHIEVYPRMDCDFYVYTCAPDNLSVTKPIMQMKVRRDRYCIIHNHIGIPARFMMTKVGDHKHQNNKGVKKCRTE